MSGWLQDLKVGWRSLMRTPGFTIVVVLVMGLGIGVNTMVFNIANAFLFRPLPFVDDARNVTLFSTDVKHDVKHMEMSYPDFCDVRDRARSFDAVAGYFETAAYIT